MTRWSQPVTVFAHLFVGLVVTNPSLSSPANAQQPVQQPVQQPTAQSKPAQPIAQQVAAPGKLAPGAGNVSELVSLLQAIDPYLPPKTPEQQIKGKVVVHGSTSMDAMAHIWANGFNEFHKDSKVEIAASGSHEAFEALIANPTCVAMLSHPVRPEELTALKEKGLKDPAAFVVAREALGVFVHKSNPVQSITGEQLRAIFTTDNGGEAPTWGMLGATGEWASKPIHVISRSESSGTQVYLRDFVFGGCTMRDGVSKHVSNAETLAAVTADPLGIAICGLKSSGASVRALSLRNGNNLIPSDEHAVLSGIYPLTRPLTVVVDLGQSDANAKASQAFVHYALCQAGQAAAISASYFPVDLPLLRASLHKLQGEQLR